MKLSIKSILEQVEDNDKKVVITSLAVGVLLVILFVKLVALIWPIFIWSLIIIAGLFIGVYLIERVKDTFDKFNKNNNKGGE